MSDIASRTVAWHGGPAGDRVTSVLCANPGPMTLDGTNTWVLGGQDAEAVVVVDPGPLQQDHLDAVLESVTSRGARVALTLLTHHHFDHAESAHRWAEMTGAPVRGAGHGRPLEPEEHISIDDLHLQVLATPGHTSDSICVLLPDDRVLLSGDTVLGRGTSVVTHPDGDIGEYLASLDRLIEVTESGVDVIAPGHGPVVDRPLDLLTWYREHRHQRLDQVRAALADGAADAGDQEAVVEAVVRSVYADVPPSVWPAARLTVTAQLAYLQS